MINHRALCSLAAALVLIQHTPSACCMPSTVALHAHSAHCMPLHHTTPQSYHAEALVLIQYAHFACCMLCTAALHAHSACCMPSTAALHAHSARCMLFTAALHAHSACCMPQHHTTPSSWPQTPWLQVKTSVCYGPHCSIFTTHTRISALVET